MQISKGDYYSLCAFQYIQSEDCELVKLDNIGNFSSKKKTREIGVKKIEERNDIISRFITQQSTVKLHHAPVHWWSTLGTTKSPLLSPPPPTTLAISAVRQISMCVFMRKIPQYREICMRLNDCVCFTEYVYF